MGALTEVVEANQRHSRHRRSRATPPPRASSSARSRSRPSDEIAAVVARARRAQAAWAVLPSRSAASACSASATRSRSGRRRSSSARARVRQAEARGARARGHHDRSISRRTTPRTRRAILAPQEIPLHLLKHRRSFVHFVPRGVIGDHLAVELPVLHPDGRRLRRARRPGSAVVVKPSEVTPLVMKKAKEIYDSTGLPEDLFAVVLRARRGGAGAHRERDPEARLHGRRSRPERGSRRRAARA